MVREFSPEMVVARVSRARRAQSAWDACGVEARAAVLRRLKRWLIDSSQRIVDVVVSETGKASDEVVAVELGYTLAALDFWCKTVAEYLSDEEIESISPFARGRRLVIRRCPVGVVGVIGPWNFPLANCFGDCIPALLAGNSVVLKPSEVTPHTSLLMVDGLKDCGLPDDVFQVVTGGGVTGEALIDEADFVAFTGSSATGRKVMERASRTLTPVSLELGGKDPMIVLADADIDRATEAALSYGMANAGQVCVSVERIYVEAPVYDEFVTKVAEGVAALRVGPPRDHGSIDVGAIIGPHQARVIADHIADATARGARTVAIAEGVPEGDTSFYAPTVLVDVDHSMKAMTVETFGPTLPIMKVADAEEAVRLANDSIYGLNGSVWTGDVRRGEEIARRLEVGAACVNDATMNYLALELPFGGWKDSGIGVRHGGPEGIRKYTREQALMVADQPPSAGSYPYTPAKTQATLELLEQLFVADEAEPN